MIWIDSISEKTNCQMVSPAKIGSDPDHLGIRINKYRLEWKVNYRVFFHWCPPKKLKYGKPRLGESTLT